MKTKSSNQSGLREKICALCGNYVPAVIGLNGLTIEPPFCVYHNKPFPNPDSDTNPPGRRTCKHWEGIWKSKGSGLRGP